AVDGAGNAATPFTGDYTLQFAPPSLITVPTQDQTNTTSNSYTLSVTANPINTIISTFLEVAYNGTSQDINISALQASSPFNVVVGGLAPNTQYNSIQGAFGHTSPVASDPSASSLTNATPQNASAWTLPLAVAAAPTITSPSAGTITVSFSFAANPSGSNYTAQVSKDGFATLTESPLIAQGSTPSYTFTNLAPGQYAARIRSVSASNNTALDVFSPVSGTTALPFLPPTPLSVDPTPADFTNTVFSLIVGNPNTGAAQP